MSRLRWLTPVLAALFMLLAAPPAHAIDMPNPLDPFGDCKDAPSPQMPGRGIAGVFEGAPDPLPVADDPWAKNPTTTIYEQYGFAGLRWNTYALGSTGACVPGPSDASASALTGVANLIDGLAAAAFAATFALTRIAFGAGEWLGVLDPLLRTATSTFYDHITMIWMPLTVIAVGLYLLWRARRMDYSETTRTAGWALLIITIAVFIVQWPVVTGKVFDGVVTGATGSVNAAMAGDQSRDGDAATAVAGNAHKAVMYNAWLRGALGTDSGATARKYGPDLFRASAYTWREAARCERDPDWCEQITEEKKDLWTETAAKVEDADPDAYEALQGKRSDDRIAAAGLAVAGSVAITPFLAIAALLVIVALLMTRIGVLIFPVLAIFGAHVRFRAVVERVGSAVAGAVMNAILFGFGSAVLSLATGTLLRPSAQVPVWLALVLLAVLTILLWKFTKPFRSFAAMSPLAGPVDRGRGLLRGAADKALGYALTRHAVGEELEEDREERQPSAPTAAPSEATFSAPPPETPTRNTSAAAPMALPAVAPGASPTPSARHALEASAASSALPPAPASPARVPLSQMQRPNDLPSGEADGWTGDPASSATDVAGPPAAPSNVPRAPDNVYQREHDHPAVAFDEMPDIVEPEIDEQGNEVYVLYRREDSDAV